MKLKNKKNVALLLIAIIFVLTACGSSSSTFIEKEVNPQINVLGVNLNMDESEVLNILGNEGEKANCVYGYEYEFKDKHINVGFDSGNKKVRRITTKNSDTSIYGIKAGIELSEAYKLIEQNGFEKTDDKYKFTKENIILSIISMKSTHADGITAEIKPE